MFPRVDSAPNLKTHSNPGMLRFLKHTSLHIQKSDFILGSTPKKVYSWGIGYGTATGHVEVHLMYSTNLFEGVIHLSTFYMYHTPIRSPVLIIHTGL